MSTPGSSLTRDPRRDGRDGNSTDVGLEPRLARPKISEPLLEPRIDLPQTFTRSTAISVAVDPVALITTECVSVTSAMRKHARWAHTSVSAILSGGGAGGKEFAFDSARTSMPRDSSSRPSSLKPDAATAPGATPDAEIGLASRWGLRGKKGKSMQDNPLMSAFAKLRGDLVSWNDDIRSFDTPSLLHPFLQVIRSSSTSAPITSLALVAITKFFAYNLICADSPRLPLAMQMLSSAITHCRFEATDSAADEIVLLRILNLMEGMLSGPAGNTLGDESVCEMMETGLSMCCQFRLSELLRRSAEMSMVTMCQVIFERLKHLETEAGEELKSLEEITKEDMNLVKMDPSANGTNVAQVAAVDALGNARSPLVGEETVAGDDAVKTVIGPATPPTHADADAAKTEVPETQLSESTGSDEIKPYSLPSIRELFRVLVDLLDPHDSQHTDAMRVMALRIVDVALEVAGPSITKHPSLSDHAKDHLCRFLFQLVRSDNMAILHESLRVAGTLLATCRGVLKLQQELFLSYLVACLHPRVEIPREAGIDPALYEGVPQTPKIVKPPPSQPSSGRSTPVPVKDRQKLGMEGGTRKPDAREAMVESVGALARIPSFMVELFVNYDCEVDRGDLCEDMVGLLSRNAFPDSATWSTTNVPPLCLDALLGYVQFVWNRLDDEAVTQGYPSPTELRRQRSLKKIIIRGASKFNENPKAGIAFLAHQGIIENPDDPLAVTRFLHGTSRVSKKMLGEFLSKRSNERFLEAYLDQFNFTGQRVDEALRDLLESFRLPGESPLIERIVTSFSEKYCAHSTPEGVADKDAVYVLTYAIIMLNTDQHNPNLKAQNRMSYHDFARNLRGVNGGKDFAPEYLQDIYASIKTNEIILPDEHDNKHAFDYAWKELLVKTSSERDLVLCNTNIFDADMFAATWRPIVATLSYVFLSASDDASFSRVVSGFGQCAQIAARYSLTEALDHIIFSLGTISSLASGAPPNTALNTEVQVGEERIMVSELAVKFGRDFKARLATVVLFRVVLGNEAVIRKGWDHIVRIWLNLFTNSLIPAYFSSNQSSLEMPPIPVQNPSQVIDRGARTNESGIFSAFTSYLSSYAADDPPEPSDEELESTLCTVDCVKACSLEGVFANILLMPPQALKSLVGSLLRQLPEENSPVVIVVKPEVPASGPTNVRRPATKGIVYDPTVVYVLELATVIALRDEEMISTLGKDVAEAIQSVIRDASNVHHIVLSRAIYYLFSLLKGSHHHSFLRAPVILHSISSLEQSVQEKSATYILKGLARCIAEPGALRNEMTNSPDFWSILKALSPTKEGAPIVFEIVESVAVGEFPAITADNYEATIALLNGYASVGSVGAAIEQAQDKVNKKGKPGKSGRVQENDTVARGAKAIGIIYRLTSRVEGLIEKSHLEQNEAWAVYWSPIFRALTKQCVNPCRQIRHQALSSLQRSLLSPSVTSTAHDEWTIIFTEVLFPLIVRLLKPEVYQTDPAGMSETRVQAATLLCKIFLHYLVALSEWEGMLDLWLHILDLMDRLMNSGQGDTLDEAVPESLKNILLVMSDGGFLVPRAQDPRARRLWSETWKRLDRFLPELLRDLFPDEQQPRTTPHPSPSIPQAPLKPLLEQQATAGSASISSSSSLLSNDELSNSAAPFTSTPAATAATGAATAATKSQSSPPRPSSSSSSPPPIIPPEPSTISATTTTTEVPQDEGVD